MNLWQLPHTSLQLCGGAASLTWFEVDPHPGHCDCVLGCDRVEKIWIIVALLMECATQSPWWLPVSQDVYAL